MFECVMVSWYSTGEGGGGGLEVGAGGGTGICADRRGAPESGGSGVKFLDGGTLLRSAGELGNSESILNNVLPHFVLPPKP